MVKVLNKLVVFLALILLFTNFNSASVIKGNTSYFIEPSYGPGEQLSGWVNISLNAQPANSIFLPSWGSSISLLNLVKESRNVAFTYTCSPPFCTSDYTSTNPASSKTFLLNPGESVIVGFKVVSSKLITEFSSFSIRVSQINKESEDIPLVIDIFNDGEEEWQTYNASTNYKSKNYGCFELENTTQAIISTNTYCQTITFDSPSPEVVIGAKVSGSGRANFGMSITGEGLSSEPCTAIASGTGEINCTAKDFKIIPGEYTVCLTAGTLPASREYKINTEVEEPCGFAGSSSYLADFEIFAQPKKYTATGQCPLDTPNLCTDSQGNGFCISETCPTSSSILLETTCPSSHPNICNATGEEKTPFCINNAVCPNYISLLNPAPTNFTLNNAEFKRYLGDDLAVESKILTHISDVYNDNCSKGCVIPIKFTAGTRQKLTLSVPNLEYTVGITSSIEELQDLTEIPAKVSSGFGRLFLDPMNISVPKIPGNYTFILSLGGTNLIAQKILVENAPYITYITPIVTAKNYPTVFKLKVNSNKTVSKYKWNFGDGQFLETDKGRASHAYKAVGEYLLSVEAINSEGKSTSKTFNIKVENASTVVPALINKTNQTLFVIKKAIANYSTFEKLSLNRSLNLSEAEKLIIRLQTNFSAKTEAEYEVVLKQLVDSQLPDRILKTASGASSRWYLKEDNIDLSYLKSLWGVNTTITQEEAYKDEIAAWVWENINLSMSFKEISGDYDGESKVVTQVFDINVSKKNAGVNNSYLIIKNLKNMFFQEDYSQSIKEGYTVIPLNKLNQEIVFSTSEKLDVSDIPMIIAPSMSELTILDIDNTPEKNTALGRKALFIIVSSIVVLLGGVIWFLLQKWYKRKYEKYLFNDRNNLYNIINYIHDSKKAGIKDGEISKQLKGNGWSSEQITYALKRYKGKRIGMI